MSRRVVVVGDVMLDVVVKRLAPTAPTSDTPSDIRAGRGGSGASVALAISNSGHEVVYIGAAGVDGAAALVRDALVKANVIVQLESVDAPTGTVVSLVGEDGSRAMLTDRGANSLLSKGFVMGRLGEPFDHLHISGYVLLDPATRATAVAALAIARERRRTSSIDACSLAPLREMGINVFLEAASSATQLFANEEEALALSETNNVDDALEVLAGRFDEVVITRGAKGAVAATKGERSRVQVRAAEVLDTTGAGDAATGSYVGARLRGEDPATALAHAMEVAARVVERLGAD